MCLSQKKATHIQNPITHSPCMLRVLSRAWCRVVFVVVIIIISSNASFRFSQCATFCCPNTTFTRIPDAGLRLVAVTVPPRYTHSLLERCRVASQIYAQAGFGTAQIEYFWNRIRNTGGLRLATYIYWQMSAYRLAYLIGIIYFNKWLTKNIIHKFWPIELCPTVSSHSNCMVGSNTINSSSRKVVSVRARLCARMRVLVRLLEQHIHTRCTFFLCKAFVRSENRQCRGSSAQRSSSTRTRAPLRASIDLLTPLR